MIPLQLSIKPHAALVDGKTKTVPVLHMSYPDHSFADVLAQLPSPAARRLEIPEAQIDALTVEPEPETTPAPQPWVDAKPFGLTSCIGTDAWTDHPAPRPWDAETVKSEIARRVEWNTKHPKWSKLATKDPSQDALDFLRSLAGQAMRDDGKRHSAYMYLLGVDSSSKMTAAQVSSLIWWIKNGTNGPNEFAAKEAEACVTARNVEVGQQSLFDEGDAGSVEKTNGTA